MEALRERFGKYHVLEKIAQGGMAEVYKVKTVGIAGFEKIQALKRILPRQAREGRFIRSFIDEARIAVELTHRNIVQVFDFGKADGELFLAMELIEGKDLRTAMAEAVARDALPPVPIAAYILSEVASGLDYAHRKADGYGGSLGIVHCDVSPSNVMLSREGDIKILDFGIARATFASALEQRRLRGKPRYMSPEQTIGEAATAASDVFALGIIGWELLTGLPLFRGPDLKAILEAVRRTVPPRCDRLNPLVPPEIADAIATALSREPSQRGSAADLAAACARTAMLGGARAVAAWLEQVEGQPARGVTPWQPELTSASGGGFGGGDGESFESSMDVSVHDPRVAVRRSTRAPVRVAEAPPSRPSATMALPDAAPPSRPSATVSLAHAAMRGDRRAPPRAVWSPLERTASIERTAGIERTESVVGPSPVPPAVTQFEREASTTLFRRSEAAGTAAPPVREPTVPLAKAWTPRVEPTAPRARAWAPRVEPLRLGDDELAEAIDAALDAVADEPPGEDASALLAEDEATQHGFELPPGAEDTSDDAIAEPPVARRESEAEALPSDDAPVLLEAPIDGEAPIDDELGAGAAGALAERRRIAIVAGVLSGDEPHALRPVTKALGELAYQRGGVVLELAPDQLIVAFGLEVAGEDDVAIAMGWALDAAAIARDAELHLRVGARAGVLTSSGGPIASPVTVARSADTAPRIPDEAIAQARALAHEATPERPLFVGGAGRITSSLYALRERTLDEPGAARPLGRPLGDDAGRIIEVVGPRGFDERDRARLERRGRFIGRAAQLAELDGWFQRAIAREQRMSALITGAAGTGKSRLLAELIARRGELQVIIAAASPAGRLAPFSTVIDLYQAALGLAPARGRGARAQLVNRLYHLLIRAGTSAERARAVTTDLDRAMELRDGGGVAAREVADLRPRISAGLTVFRGALARRDRVAITIVEDIHHADSASVEVLRHTLALPARGAELLVLTMRPEGPPPPTTDAVIALGDLVGHDLRSLIGDRLGDAATPTAIAAVLARGGGNPLFIEELAQAVRDANVGEDVPASARDVVSARVDRLPLKARAALRFAAVLGGTIRVRILEELLGEDGIERELDELGAAGFLVRAAGSEGELQFARGLVREVVYESLSARAQRETHARIGRLLASRFFAGREEPPALIAEHLERGGEPAGAAAFWLRAGRLAMSASDTEAAVACFTRTLVLERELGPAPPTEPSRARRREALAGREEAHRLQGDLVSDAGDLDALEALAGDARARLADLAIRRAQRALRLGDYARATDATRLAEEHAVALGDDRLRGEALRVRGEILERVGQFDEALVVVGVARQLFRRRGAVADEMAAMVGRGRIHLLRAHYEAAQSAYRPVLARIEQTGDPWLERIVTNHVAVIEMCLGNFAPAMRSAQRSLELCRRYGDRGREGDALSVAGIVLLEVGLHAQAATMFDGALELLARTNSRWSRADCLIYAGTCEQRRGRTGGIRMLDEALAEARRLGARYLEANALVARASAHLRAGALTAAIADAERGAAVAHDATLVGYEIQGLTRQALALSRLGSRAQEAVGLARRALELLDAQKHLEGSEEEVWVACARVLRAGGAAELAHAVMERGRASARRKLDALPDPTWRTAYAALPEIAELLA